MKHTLKLLWVALIGVWFISPDLIWHSTSTALSRFNAGSTQFLGRPADPAGQIDPHISGQVETQVNTTFSSTGVYFRLRSVLSSKCIDVTGASTADGATVIQFTCGTGTGGPNQQFYFKRLGDNYQLSAKHSAKCLRVSGASTSTGAAVLQSPCARSGSGLTGSQWTFHKVSGERYQIRNTNSGLCMRVRGDSTLNNAVIEQSSCSTTNSRLFTVEAAPPPAVNPPVTGQWGPVVTLPSVPVAAALLPNGKVVTWASWNQHTFGGGSSPRQTYTVVFDPVALTASEVLVTETSHDMFCPGTAMLADGRVFVNGGGNTVNETSIYDSTSGVWIASNKMAQIRWYNVSVTLADNRVFTLGGNRTSGLSGVGEIWSQSSGWTTVPGAVMTPLLTSNPANRSQEHQRLFLAPDGRIFVPGPNPNMQFYNLAGSGSIQSAGVRGDDEFSQNDTTVMFDIGKLFKAGGNPNYDSSGDADTPSSHNSYIINLNGGVTVTKTPHMRYPRAFHNGVVLPTGEVFVVGGLDNGNAFSDIGAIMVPEIFNPSAGSWTDLAPMARPRTYHSVALLLPDARVLVGGGGLCGANCAENHPDIEIYSPPYLFQGSRPNIVGAPSSVSYGAQFAASTVGTVNGFSLVRISSVTHSVNTDQRLIRLAFTGGPGLFTLTAPANGNIAPPGYYMLFALNGNVPSVAKMIRLN